MELQIGVHVRGRPGLVIDRPHGTGDFVFVHFLGPAHLSRCASVSAAAGTCIVYRPDTPGYITSDTHIFNNYLHVSTDVAEETLRRIPLPIGHPFTPRTVDYVRPLLNRIQREWVQRDRHWELAVQLSVDDLFLRLSRGIGAHTSAVDFRHAERLRQVRLTAHRSPAEHWSVARMAALAHLKESQFSVLYKRLFGQAPIQDLIEARLALAKYYLANYDFAVREVAAMCGFADLSYFSRRFHRHTGCAPSRYRQRVRSSGRSATTRN